MLRAWKGSGEPTATNPFMAGEPNKEATQRLLMVVSSTVLKVIQNA